MLLLLIFSLCIVYISAGIFHLFASLASLFFYFFIFFHFSLSSLMFSYTRLLLHFNCYSILPSSTELHSNDSIVNGKSELVDWIFISSTSLLCSFNRVHPVGLLAAHSLENCYWKLSAVKCVNFSHLISLLIHDRRVPQWIGKYLLRKKWVDHISDSPIRSLRTTIDSNHAASKIFCRFAVSW